MISVSDKKGLTQLAKLLIKNNFSILTDGTKIFLTSSK